MNFVALDFETATSKSSSACSIGLATVANGSIVDTAYWLIKPEPLEFSPWNIRVHGICPADVAEAPSLAEVWPEIYMYIQNNILVAHCAAFDMGVLRDTLKAQGVSPPPFKYACSLKIARKVWPDLARHKLNFVANHLKLDFQHHNAEEDAYASAHIVVEAGKKLGISNLEKLYKKLGKKFSILKAKK